MSIWDKVERVFKSVLPSPFTIAIILTFATFTIAWFFAPRTNDSAGEHFFNLVSHWEKGIWNEKLMVFALQMMLILVLGHVLALSKPVDKFINRFLFVCNTTAKAAAAVTFFTVLTGLFNWGLALIFGAVFARKVAEYGRKKGYNLHYPLIGAAGYSGLMVWHGGFSGSSLTKVAETGHLKDLVSDHISKAEIAQIPDFISFEHTVFSEMNIVVSCTLLIVLPLLMYLAGRNVNPDKIKIKPTVKEKKLEPARGAEKLDRLKLGGIVTGLIVLGTAVYKGITIGSFYQFFTPDNINLTLLGLALLFHGSFADFLRAVDSAIGGAAGILIQFPLYFGIMGIMNHSGLVAEVSRFVASQSTELTYPLFTFISAGIVNVFVPSGGGQWAIQGPVIVKTAIELNIPFHKGIMAMAYGDQLTNMIQPFWALPLLGITGLKAKQILPYTLILMLAGSAIFFTALIVF